MVLIVGGAGYIGSHINKMAFLSGYKTIIFDNLSTGHKEFIKWGKFIQGDLSNIDDIEYIFKRYNIEVVIHLAAFAYVGESVINPQKYYINNVVNTLNLLKVMMKYNCKN